VLCTTQQALLKQNADAMTASWLQTVIVLAACMALLLSQNGATSGQEEPKVKFFGGKSTICQWSAPFTGLCCA